MTNRSKFPEEVDEFVELFDLPFDKMKAAQRLTQLKMQAKLTNDEQNELSTLSSELQEYIITPEVWNKFADALVAVEQFFYSNVQGFIADKQKIWDSYIKQFVFVGAWKTGMSYKFQNMVRGSDGDLFISTKDHVSNSTTDPLVSATWVRLSSKGDTGEIGLNAIYKGDWNAATTYEMGDAVSFGREGWKKPLVYISKVDSNLGVEPEVNNSKWMLYSEMYVGSKRPNGAGAGLHFIQEV